ncbi:hypothetical protein [Fredinandcohnia onubensis]|uniref:hypothetical protein n=1 Tax=Fredinandcohnia onubensis TaxID=1571209 RepID=UPI000C0BD502|nr:hypothetical protein [Fredinandcohnia onubensis]
MTDSKSKYHACATCVHFVAERKGGKMIYSCARLGYDTKPAYKFNCWTPKPHIVKLMKTETTEEK